MDFQNFKKYIPHTAFLFIGILIGIAISITISFLISHNNADRNIEVGEVYLEKNNEEELLNEEEVKIEEAANQELTNFYNDYLTKVLSLNVGDTFTYGKYEQDNIKENGKEDIEWTVLYKSNKNSILLISKKILDTEPYNLEKIDTTWQDSDIRKFLNNNFYEYSFNDYEKVLIMENEMTNNDNANYKTEAGNNTIDKVFLLSERQANRYFKKANKEYRSRVAVPTEYARKKGIYMSSEDDWCKGNATYWLRTPGIENTRAEIIDEKGEIFMYGELVSSVEVGIRPCIWIKY